MINLKFSPGTLLRPDAMTGAVAFSNGMHLGNAWTHRFVSSDTVMVVGWVAAGKKVTKFHSMKIPTFRLQVNVGFLMSCLLAAGIGNAFTLQRRMRMNRIAHAVSQMPG